MRDNLDNNLHREDLTLATIKSRSMAFFIDEILLSFLLILSLGEAAFADKTLIEWIDLMNSFLLEFMAVKFAYQAFFVSVYGATLGKMAMKIRIISATTVQSPLPLQAIIRSAIRVPSEALFYLGFLWGNMDPLRQTWHDKAAKTLVVNV